ncbi:MULTISPECIES: helix-turn-helix transcriptional regulator [Methylococcus]|uniref:AlpA family phage regulatory protein n=1 Tax=Methylococcus capsulatus TaxID=414 RepID=A0ABZ2F7S5_METCP|nr:MULTISPECIES: AlpA family phage regulatory protein [Methylococcus]MDF9393014.1 AlpA family phage regulatory protein [Methylococcus capsulatus]
MKDNLLPQTGFVRQADLVGTRARPATRTKKARPATKGILPVSAPTLWRMIRDGRFPRPVKLSPGVSAFRVEDVRNWMESQGKEAA